MRTTNDSLVTLSAAVMRRWGNGTALYGGDGDFRLRDQAAGDIGNVVFTKAQLVAKILDIFEGTQQIQLLIVARRLLGKSSSELK